MTTPVEILEQEYPVVIRIDRCTDETFCYLAEHPDLPGCAAHAETIAEVKMLLAHARVSYLKHLIAKGYPIPYPSRYRPLEWQTGVIEEREHRSLDNDVEVATIA